MAAEAARGRPFPSKGSIAEDLNKLLKLNICGSRDYVSETAIVQTLRKQFFQDVGHELADVVRIHAKESNDLDEDGPIVLTL